MRAGQRLHLTVAYVDDNDAALDRVSNLDVSAVTADVIGAGDLGPDDAKVLFVVSEDLSMLQSETANLDVSEHPNFHPHVTLNYGGEIERVAEQLQFDRLVVLDGDEVLTAAADDDNDRRSFSGPIGFLNLPTSDGRVFLDFATRNLPRPLRIDKEDDGAHAGAIAVARVDELQAIPLASDVVAVWARGSFANTPDADEAYQLLEGEDKPYVSVDIASAIQIIDEEENLRLYSDVEFAAVTIVDIPAFADARIYAGDIDPASVLDLAKSDDEEPEDEALTAAGAPIAPPAEWFENPQLAEPTPIQVTDDGRIFGHAALWGTCHIKDAGTPRSVTPPQSQTQYSRYRTGHVVCADGTKVATGVLTYNTGHAGAYAKEAEAIAHYDNSGQAFADVTTGEDAHGIWVSGAMRHDVPEGFERNVRGGALSGDWRRYKGLMELVNLLLVNTPGFPVAQRQLGLVAAAEEGTRSYEELEQISLIASTTPRAEGACCDDCADPSEADQANRLALELLLLEDALAD